MDFTFDDGGRADAGFLGSAGDCVTRAIAIATGLPYDEVYGDLFTRQRAVVAAQRKRKTTASPRSGVLRKAYEPYLFDLGWIWLPTMKIGQGCTTHLRSDELPEGPLVVALSKHLVAVLGGVVHDTHDPRREGTRCVYGYYEPGASAKVAACG